MRSLSEIINLGCLKLYIPNYDSDVHSGWTNHSGMVKSIKVYGQSAAKWLQNFWRYIINIERRCNVMSKQDKDKEKVLLICQDCGAEFELSYGRYKDSYTRYQ